MDVLLVVIILAMIATGVAMGLGLLAMSGGGSADRQFGTPLMWMRVGFQALTLLLLVIAAFVR